MIYFIQSGERGPVKIGMASDIAVRIRGLQTGHYETLRMVGSVDGGRDVEASLHNHFRAVRVRGEWFRGTSELLAFAAAPDMDSVVPVESSGRSGGIGRWGPDNDNPLARHLESMGITSAEFSRRSGLSESQVSRIANGKQEPSASQLWIVCRHTDGEVQPNDWTNWDKMKGGA